MELIVFVGALCIVAVLAMRFGHDSRSPAHSKEQDLANLGLGWRSSDPGENTIRENTSTAARYFRKENAR